MEKYLIRSKAAVGTELSIDSRGSIEDAIRDFAQTVGLTYRIVKKNSTVANGVEVPYAEFEIGTGKTFVIM